MAHHDAGKAELLVHRDDEVMDGFRHEGVETGSRFVEQDDSGSTTSARARPVRFFIPPLSSAGYLCPIPPRPTWSNFSSTRDSHYPQAIAVFLEVETRHFQIPSMSRTRRRLETTSKTASGLHSGLAL